MSEAHRTAPAMEVADPYLADRYTKPDGFVLNSGRVEGLRFERR